MHYLRRQWAGFREGFPKEVTFEMSFDLVLLAFIGICKKGQEFPQVSRYRQQLQLTILASSSVSDIKVTEPKV